MVAHIFSYGIFFKFVNQELRDRTLDDVLDLETEERSQLRPLNGRPRRGKGGRGGLCERS